MRGYLKIAVLKALTNGNQTGYGLIKIIEDQTGRRPSYGSIYPLLESLKEDKLVKCKEDGKKKFYSLTTNGEKQLECITDKKEELIGKIQEAMRIFEMIHGQALGPYQTRMLDKMKKENMDLTHIMPPEVMKMKEIWAKLIVEERLEKNKTQINTILKKANDELRKLK
jgi:formylmethanofuran dehydrogenase subunit E